MGRPSSVSSTLTASPVATGEAKGLCADLGGCVLELPRRAGKLSAVEAD